MRPSTHLQGTVRAGVGHTPPADARVTLMNAAGDAVADAITGADGGYDFTDLDACEYTVIAAGHPPASVHLTVGGGHHLEVRTSNWSTAKPDRRALTDVPARGCLSGAAVPVGAPSAGTGRRPARGPGPRTPPSGPGSRRDRQASGHERLDALDLRLPASGLFLSVKASIALTRFSMFRQGTEIGEASPVARAPPKPRGGTERIGAITHDTSRNAEISLLGTSTKFRTKERMMQMTAFMEYRWIFPCRTAARTPTWRIRTAPARSPPSCPTWTPSGCARA
ncbi:carboxypeptidase-like regulatory domain-containing protein [Streptomyces sp. NPDC002845]